MTQIEELIAVSKTYAEARGISLSRTSTLIFGDGMMFKRLSNGCDLTTGRWAKGMQWLSDHWPEGAHWPAEVARPEQSSATSGEVA